MYIPLYFWAEGRLSVDKEKWYKFRTYKADVEYSQRRAALRLLLWAITFPVAIPAHNLFSYPLAYSLVVLPVSIARWSSFNHKSVSSAATFFAVSMHDLSGAINVFLFLVVRPQLLLFTPPEETIEHEMDLARHGMSSAMLPDTAGNSATLSRVNSRARSVDSDI